MRRRRIERCHPWLLPGSALVWACSGGEPLELGRGAGGLGASYFGPTLTPGAGFDDEGPGNNPWLSPDGVLIPVAEGSLGEDQSDESGSAEPSRDAPARSVTGELILSEYEESTGAAKALALLHTGGSALLYGDCQVEVYANGGTKPFRRIQVPAVVPGSEIYLCTSGPPLWPDCQAQLSTAPFNGNDALVVVCGERLVDSFGQVGFDPGAAWTSGTISSKDQHLLRCTREPDREPFDPFLIGADWVTRAPEESPEQARKRCPGAGEPPPDELEPPPSEPP